MISGPPSKEHLGKVDERTRDCPNQRQSKRGARLRDNAGRDCRDRGRTYESEDP